MKRVLHNAVCLGAVTGGALLLVAAQTNPPLLPISEPRFALVSESVSVSLPRVIGTGDLNGDGKCDLVVSSSTETLLFFGKGDGTFGAAPTALSIRCADIAIHDLNGDGRLDLVMAKGQSGIGLLLGNGDGTFAAEFGYARGFIDGIWLQSSSVVVMDHNGDGIPDIVTGNYEDRTTTVFRGFGNGRFAAPQNVLFRYNLDPRFVSLEPVSEAFHLDGVADFDGDGQQDIVGSDGANTYLLQGQTGSPRFVVEPLYALYRPTVADFDLNGTPDIAAVTWDRSLSICLGLLNGAFAPAVSHPLPDCASLWGGRDLIATGDFNSDGKPDIAVPVEYCDKVFIYLNNTPSTLPKTSPGDCVFLFSQERRVHGSDAENGGVDVTTTGDCQWTAISGAPWITITSGGDHNGNGTVTYSVQANETLAERSATLRIGDRGFIVVQAAADWCNLSLETAQRIHGPEAATDTIVIKGIIPVCPWWAASNDDWIHVNASGRGTQCAYSVDAHPGSRSRTGTIVVAGRTFTITQRPPTIRPELVVSSVPADLRGAYAQVVLRGGVDHRYAIEGSSDLRDWKPLILSDSYFVLELVDPTVATLKARFYRAVEIDNRSDSGVLLQGFPPWASPRQLQAAPATTTRYMVISAAPNSVHFPDPEPLLPLDPGARNGAAAAVD